ncbi:MAG: YlqD family protein [Selenomonadaceae bacterium]|nr:YlqD family protein [Selenomonadaceae bacterium]
MESISLKVPVTIKAKLTEKLKATILEDLENNIKQAELEVQQINIQERRVIDESKPDVETPEGAQQMHAIQQHFGVERQKRLEFRAQALEKKEETEKLAIGAEIIQGTLERQVEVHVGDDMREIMNMEVLVEDDKIIAIRG